jgi:very-short-patch-repair endonuclease
MATKQQGIVTRRQLAGAGLSPGQIRFAVKDGVLHRVYRGVYAVGHLALAPQARERAALLACGPGSVISHHSAAYLWGLTDEAPKVIDVTLVGRRCRPKPGIRLHLDSGLDRHDLRHRHNLLITSPARTIIDLAAETRMDQQERLIAEARVKRLIQDGELEKALERNAGRPGTRRLRAVLEAEGKPGITRSEAERILRRLLRQAGLPQPQTNVMVGRYEVDFVWPEQRVAIELDSWQFHRHRQAFEQDRRKGLALQAAGLDLSRLSALQIRDEPFPVIAQIARALDRATRGAARGVLTG